MQVVKLKKWATCHECFDEDMEAAKDLPQHFTTAQYTIVVGKTKIKLCKQHLARLLKISITQLTKE